MGLFDKHVPKIRDTFIEIFEEGANQTENEFLDQINIVIRMIEVEKRYSTNQKLKIYELFSQLSNCSASDRPRYARKIKRVL